MAPKTGKAKPHKAKGEKKKKEEKGLTLIIFLILYSFSVCFLGKTKENNSYPVEYECF